MGFEERVGAREVGGASLGVARPVSSGQLSNSVLYFSLPLNSLLLSEDWRALPLKLKTESHCVAQVGLPLTILLSLPLSTGITGLQPE